MFGITKVVSLSVLYANGHIPNHLSRQCLVKIVTHYTVFGITEVTVTLL